MKRLAVLLIFMLMAANAPQKEPSHKRLHDLDIPESSFVSVNLVDGGGVQLPIKKYPDVGNFAAFRLMPTKGQKNIDIVIRTQLVTDEFLDELKMHHAHAKNKNKDKASALERLRQIALENKDKEEGVTAFYARVKHKKFKLINIRVPGTTSDGQPDQEALIVATPKGNLQLFEPAKDQSDDPNKMHVIELNTRHAQ